MKITFVRGALAFVIAASASAAANADDACFTRSESNNFDRFLGSHDSWGIATQQARDTWDDWIWTGEEFDCNPRGGKCTYTWTKAKTTGYNWSVGVDMKLDNLPIIGNALNMFNIKGQYQYAASYTETFGWNQELFPGQHAEPVQVVRRRWKSGYFRGGWWRVNGGNCVVRHGSRGVAQVNGNRYWWDGEARYGSWSANEEVKRVAIYHIW